MVWLAALLELLQFLEFIASPLGLTASLWIALDLGLVWGLLLDPAIAATLSGLVALKFYFLVSDL